MTIHLVGLPHTQFDDVHYSSCAYTAKAVRLARMLRMRGWDVTVYWGGDMADVSLMSTERQIEYFGEYDPRQLPVIGWDSRSDYWQEFHLNALRELNQRLQPGDIIGLIGGSIAHELIDIFKRDYTIVEPGVGYEGIHMETFACFESYAWMHNRYGAYHIGNGRAFDAVIGNAVDPAEWDIASSKGYALFVGRLINRKGPHVAAQIANAAGLKLIMAGGGVAHQEPGKVIATDGTVIEGDVEHIGPVVGKDRRRLFAEAEVFICPTLYIGPWEGVHAEAMMSGIPVVAPDYGVFTETLPREHRYRTFRQAVRAVQEPFMPRGKVWRGMAINQFGISVCADQYDEWFNRLLALRDGRNGWYDA